MASEKLTIPAVFARIVKLIASDFVPMSLLGVVENVFSGSPEALKNAVLSTYQRKTNAQVTRTSAAMFSHAIFHQIDGLIDAPEVSSSVITQDQKLAVGAALATQAAHELAKAAAFLLAYPDFQNAVAVAKTHPDAAVLADARRTRDAAQLKFKESLINVGRLVAGDVPQEQ